MIDFIGYLTALKPEDWNKIATPKWTVKDVVAHMVGWEKRDAEVIKIFWETKKREPWMSTRAEWDEFNRKEVERYKNYTPQQLLQEWEMWQKKVTEEIGKIGYENIKSRPDLFDWILEDEGHYTLNEGGSHYEHHYEQIKKAVDEMNYIDKLAWVYIKDKRLLCARSKGQDAFFNPGGKREKGESDEQALIREIKEELGVDLVPSSLRYFDTFEAPAHGKSGVIVRMTCYTGDFVGTITPASEIEEIAWLTSADGARTSEAGRFVLSTLRDRGLIN